MVLSIAGNFEERVWDSLQWHNNHTSFNQNPSSGSEMKPVDRRTDMISHICSHLMQIVHKAHIDHRVFPESSKINPVCEM
jgi:hypothetical protein